MVKILANIIGVFAVITFLLSYQLKKRKNIILCNSAAKIMYIIQYLLLNAYEGAVLDLIGVLSSVVAHKKDNKYIRKYLFLCFAFVNGMILAVGIWLYKDIFSIFPVVAVVLHTGAFWLNDERKIRIVSFLGSPFWLVYNLASAAYGSAIGDILTMVSIGVAIYRYDIRNKKQS